MKFEDVELDKTYEVVGYGGHWFPTGTLVRVRTKHHSKGWLHCECVSPGEDFGLFQYLIPEELKEVDSE